MSICSILVFFVSLIMKGSEKDFQEVVVVPGEGIAGVEFGMNIEQVKSILGKPSEIVPIDEFEDSIEELHMLLGKTIAEAQKLKILRYREPFLFVILNEYEKVIFLRLGNTKGVDIRGYSKLKSSWLSLDALERLGTPSSVLMDKRAKLALMEQISGNLEIEFYTYDYKKIGMILHLRCDYYRKKKSDYYISLKYITLYQKTTGIHVDK